MNSESACASPRRTVLKGEFTRSRIFPGTKRAYSIYIPNQYTSLEPACLYVSQDGMEPAFAEALDLLIEQREMPVTIGVFIHPGTVPAPTATAGGRNNRCYEYDSLGDDYARFLLEEFLPFITKEYQLNLSADGNDRAIGGVSSGAICAFNVAWERPDSFRRVYSNSGSFIAFRGGQTFPVLIRKNEAKPIRIYLHAPRYDSENNSGSWWLANQELERALAYSGYDYKYCTSEGKHCDRYVEDFPQAMRWLWRDHPEPITAGKGAVEFQDILILEEPWILVGEGYPNSGSLTANSSGEVFFCDTTSNCLCQIDLDGKIHVFTSNAKRVCGLASGRDGRIYGVSTITAEIVAFENDGGNEIIANGIPGSCLVSSCDGHFYVTGRLGSLGIVWRVSAGGDVTLVDETLRHPTGISLSSDGWQLYVADGASHRVYAFKSNSDGSLSSKQSLVWLHVPDTADDSGAEAVCVDRKNNLYIATGMGIQTSTVHGHNDSIISSPGGRISGLCFGGNDFSTLYAICGDKIFRRKVKAQGIHAFHEPTVPPLK